MAFRSRPLLNLLPNPKSVLEKFIIIIINDMHKTAQAWFAGGPSTDIDKTSSSLLADWNAYAAASDPAPDDSSSLDLEAAVRTVNNKVTSTFGV